MKKLMNLDGIVIQALANLARFVECNDVEETGNQELKLLPKERSEDYAYNVSVAISPSTMAKVLGVMGMAIREAYEYQDESGVMGYEALECPSIVFQNCPFSGREDPFDIDGPEGNRALVDRAADAVDSL